MSGQPDRPRVCVFSTAHDATDSRVVGREATSVADAGYDVTYYTPIDGESPVEVVAYGDHDGDVSVPGVGERLRRAGELAARLRGTDYDVYHFHDVELLPVGVLLGALTGAEVLYDVHENVEDVLRHKEFFPEPVRPYLASAASVVERGLARYVDAVVAASPDVAERFEGYDDVAVVTNYPRREWAAGTDLDAKRRSATEGPVRFVYSGLVSADRGVLTLVDAVERVPDEYDVRLAVGGKYASEEIESRIAERARRSDRVELLDWLPTLADVVDRFRRADVGTMCFHPDPNKTNAVHRSNKLFQYMAAGLPVIVSDVGDWPAFVADVDCGVAVDPERPDDVADAMVELADDADRRLALGANGRDAVLDRYNWEAERETLLDVYDRLAGGTADADATGPGSGDDYQTTVR